MYYSMCMYTCTCTIYIIIIHNTSLVYTCTCTCITGIIISTCITVTSTCTMYVHILYMYIQYELFSYY